MFIACFCDNFFLFSFVLLQIKAKGLNEDIHKEYLRQREHLEKSVASLRKQLVQDTELHRLDNVRIMQVIIF